MKVLWEIFVPTARDNVPVKTRSHKEWDKRVKRITGGLTIYHPVKGYWESPDGQTFAERMIPVRILCSREEIEQIAELTLEFYNQEAVMYYLISQQAFIKHRKQDGI